MKYYLSIILLIVGTLDVVSQNKNGDESIQFMPRTERVDKDSLKGDDLDASNVLRVSFSAFPTPAMCGERCMTRALLVLSYGSIGAASRYIHGRINFDASVDLAVSGRNSNTLQWTYPTQPSLVIEGTATSTKPVATIVLDVTEYSDLACTAGAATSNDIVVTINAIDTEGLTAEMVDSLSLFPKQHNFT